MIIKSCLRIFQTLSLVALFSIAGAVRGETLSALNITEGSEQTISFQYLQVGSYGKQSNALSVQSQLLQKLPVSVQVVEVESGDERLYRVLAGPIPSGVSRQRIVEQITSEGYTSPVLVNASYGPEIESAEITGEPIAKVSVSDNQLNIQPLSSGITEVQLLLKGNSKSVSLPMVIGASDAASSRSETTDSQNAPSMVETIDDKVTPNTGSENAAAVDLPVISPAPMVQDYQQSKILSRYLQVGSYGKQENALKAQRKLSEKLSVGVKVTEAESGGRRLYRVLVGPLATEDAQELIDQIISAGYATPILVSSSSVDEVAITDSPSQQPQSVNGTITLADLVNRSLSINPEVQADTAKVQQMMTEVSIAENGYWPSLELSAGPERGLTGELGYDVVLSQMLFDWGKVSSNVDAASAKERQQANNLLITRNDAALELVEILFDIQTARQKLVSVESYTARLESLHKLIEERAKGGYSDSAEMGRIRQALGYMDEERGVVNGQLLKAESQYRLLLNKQSIDLPSLEAPVNILDRYATQNALDKVVARSPKSLSAQEELNLAQAQMNNADAAIKPRVVLEAGAQKRSVGGQMTQDSSIALRIKMDPMQGLSGFQRVKSEEQGLKAAQWRIDAVHRELIRGFNTKRETSLAQIQRMRALDVQLSHTSAIRNTYKEQFVAGLRTLDDLIGMEREAYGMESQKVTASNEYYRIPYRAAAELGLLIQMIAGEL